MKNKLLLATAIVLAGGGYFLARERQPEPRHRGKPIRAWIHDLAHDDYRVNLSAVEAIQSFGPEAVPYLMRALRVRDASFTRALAPIAKQIPFLHWDAPDPAVLRAVAAGQLGELAARDVKAIAALVEALDERNPLVRAEVERALRRIGGAGLPQLTQALEHRRSLVRQGAAEVLKDFGALAEAAVPALTRALGDREEAVRARAAQALGAVRSGDDNSMRALGATLRDPSGAARCASAEALGKIGPRALFAAGLLTEKLRDADTAVRIAAARSLWQITGQSDAVVPVLVEALKDRRVGWQVPFVLGELGPRASRAIPGLIEALRKEQVPRPLRSPPSAALALGHIGHAAVPELMKALHDGAPRVRTSAAIALGFIGSSAREAAPDLIALLKDKELEVRQAAALSLGSIGAGAKEVVPTLLEMTRDDDVFVSNAAATALWQLAPEIAGRIGAE